MVDSGESSITILLDFRRDLTSSILSEELEVVEEGGGAMMDREAWVEGYHLQ